MTTTVIAELPEGHLGPVGSAIVGYGICFAVPLVSFLVLVMGWLRERVQATKARASFVGAALRRRLLLAFAVNSRQWYETKLVDGGSGPLAQATPAPPG